MLEIEDLVEMIDIREFISQFVELERRKDGYWGLSPFTGEETPSFHVDLEENYYFDFSSHTGGNVFTFVKNYYKCDGRKAFEVLEKYVGLDSNDIVTKRKLEVTKICKKFKTDNTQKPKNISSYPPDVMDVYEVRWDKLKVWINEGIAPEVLARFNVRYDALSNRLVYPITDLRGKIVNIGGRTLDADYKEKKMRKYTYFGKWGSMDMIYGLYENLRNIKNENEIILFEGCKSVFLAETWGIKNTAAILTSHLNSNQLRQLIQLGVKVTFALDKDVNIMFDSKIKLLCYYTEVYYIKDWAGLLDAKDAPVDKGRDVFLKLYSGRRRYK